MIIMTKYTRVETKQSIIEIIMEIRKIITKKLIMISTARTKSRFIKSYVH